VYASIIMMCVFFLWDMYRCVCMMKMKDEDGR